MSKVETKLIGTTITSSATFKDAVGAVIAPATVNLKYKKPGSAVQTIVVTPDVSNKYTQAVLLDVAGTWFFRWESLGLNSIADEFSVQVTDTKVK